MRNIILLSMLIVLATCAISNAQSYSQPAYIISSGAVNSSSSSYSNFGVLGEVFVNTSATGNSYNNTVGFLNSYKITVGIKKDLSVLKSKIYPNPTNRFITIEFSETPQNYTLEIHNNLGQLIIQKQSSNQIEKIDLGYVPQGMYFIKIYNPKFSKTGKIIVN